MSLNERQINRFHSLIAIILLICTTCFCFNAAIAETCDEPESYVKIKKLLEKTTTDKYIKKFNKVILKAQKYAEKKYQDQAVIVSDIDETVLDNRDYYEKYKVYNDEDWRKWVAQSNADPIQPTIDFLSWAKQKGYKVILITGRSEMQKEATVENLKKAGVPFDEIYCKPVDYNHHSAVPYKSSVRKKIADQGYKIIVNIGDQKSDLKGGFGKGFKLPNPVYQIP